MLSSKKDGTVTVTAEGNTVVKNFTNNGKQDLNYNSTPVKSGESFTATGSSIAYVDSEVSTCGVEVDLKDKAFIGLECDRCDIMRYSVALQII